MALVLVFMAAALTAVVFAEGETGSGDAAGEPTDFFELFGNAYNACGANAQTAPQTGSLGNNAVGLKPVDEVSPDEAWFEYKLDIPADCAKIEFVISYAASGDRHMDLTAFDTETRHVTCPDTSGWSSFLTITETFESVKKGSYMLRLAAPADFDNSSIKTPNIDIITVNMYYESYESFVPETEAPATETAAATEEATKAPADNSSKDPAGNTPETESTSSDGGCGSSLGAASAVIAACAVFGCAVVRKNDKRR